MAEIMDETLLYDKSYSVDRIYIQIQRRIDMDAAGPCSLSEWAIRKDIQHSKFHSQDGQSGLDLIVKQTDHNPSPIETFTWS